MYRFEAGHAAGFLSFACGIPNRRGGVLLHEKISMAPAAQTCGFRLNHKLCQRRWLKIECNGVEMVCVWFGDWVGIDVSLESCNVVLSP